MKNLFAQDNVLWVALFLIGMANFFLPMAINLNGLTLTFASVFIIGQIRSLHVFKNFLNPYFLFCCLLFSVYAFSCLYSDNIDFAKDSLGRKVLLVVFPVALFLVTRITVKHFKLIVALFTISNLMVLFISIISSGIRAYQLNDLSQVTHNNLCLFFELQATYFALYLMTNIVLLVVLYQYKLFTKRPLLLALLILFTVGILLSGARSMYVALFLFAIFFVVRAGITEKKIRRKHVLWAAGILLILSLVVYKVKPLNNRIQEALQTDLSLVTLNHFEHDTPFNGVTLRLLFWKFGFEILAEEKAFVQGVGIGDAQDLLQQKFYQYNVYTGNPDYNDTGYLHYNYHSQFMQVVMHIGFAGLAVFLGLFGIAAAKIAKNSGWLLASIVFIYLLVFISESALERQYGLSHVFFWLPLLYRVNLKNAEAQ